MRKFLYSLFLLLLCTTPAEAGGTALGAIGTTENVYTTAQADATFQPLDADLTSIAALTTTAFGRGLLDDADLQAALNTIGSTRGSILEVGASGWTTITPGTSGHVFTSNGAGADPSWQAPAGGGAPTNAEYLVGAVHASLSNETPLTAGGGVHFSYVAGSTARLTNPQEFGGRLNRTGTTTLELATFSSSEITIATEVLDISTPRSMATTDNRITSTGADAGAGLSASTTYYVYVSNALASPFASDLRASTVAPTFLNAHPRIGYYLGASGNEGNWRYCGIIRTNASTQFADSVTQRFVINHYNRQPLSLFVCPAYNDNNANTTWTTTSTSYTVANSGTNARIEWLVDVMTGAGVVTVTANGMSDVSTTAFRDIGIGFDSSTTAKVASGASDGASVQTPTVCSYTENSAAGYHFADILVRTSAGTATWYADVARAGGSSDPRTTYIMAVING